MNVGFGPFSEWRPSRGPITPQMTRASGSKPVIPKSDGGGGGSARALATALAERDLDRAERAMQELGALSDLDSESRKSLANLNLKHQRWERAAEIFETIDDQFSDVQMSHLLARNLSALREHRPGPYRVLTTLHSPATICQPARSSGGQLTIAQTGPSGQPVLLSPGSDPIAAAARISESLTDVFASGRCLALCGVGDGYVVSQLASKPPDLPLGRAQCVHIVEPHPEVLLAAMMIHDWCGPTGPIQDRRFQWWVGEKWPEELHAALEHDSYLPCPERPVFLSIAHAEIDVQIREIITAVLASEDRLARRIERRYANVSAEQLAALFGPKPPRTPRVLFLTTRFSTVLQHSTRDLAAAFEQSGWATRVPIEPSAHHAYLRRNLLRHLADFQPDLVVQIDHLRHEHRDLFPPQVPFVCWIQDDLPNLMMREAGKAVGVRDFVLTAAPQIYVNDYDYPSRQCITFAKRTHLRAMEPSSRRAWLHDLAFVSNASQVPRDFAEKLVRDFSTAGELLESVVRASCDAIMQRYEQGECFETVAQVQSILCDDARQRGCTWNDSGLPALLAGRLFAALNNALYRQQALGWVVEITRERGLDLGLYGAGWEDHPEFAPFARGTIEYGSALEDLTRRTRINLQIVPYSCMHQRLLDGVAAGGFFLIREHPVDRLTLAFNAIMHEASERSGEPDSIDELRAGLDDLGRNRLEAWLAQRDRFVDHRGTDPVANYRAAMRERREHLYEVLPGYDEVVFNGKKDLARGIDSFINDERARDRIIDSQLKFIERHYTYRGGVEQLTRIIADRLREESALSLAVPTVEATR